jgi:hypothetical protein
VIIAEHGPRGCELGAGCCSHAHLHLIPVPDPGAVTAAYRATGGPGHRLESLAALPGAVEGPCLHLSPQPGEHLLWSSPGFAQPRLDLPGHRQLRPGRPHHLLGHRRRQPQVRHQQVRMTTAASSSADHVIYLNHQATTPVDPRVLDAMLPYLTSSYGNPASPHAHGRQAADAVHTARRQLRDLIGASRDTEGATSEIKSRNIASSNTRTFRGTGSSPSRVHSGSTTGP